MLKTNFVLRAAVAACFGIVAGQASALVDMTGLSVTGANLVAKENVNTAAVFKGLPGDRTNLAFSVPVAYKVAAATTPMFIKFNLSGGASFVSTPTINCATALVVSGSLPVMTLGGVGTAYVVFAVPDTVTTMAGTCTAELGDITLVAGQATVALSADVEYKNGLNNAVTGRAVNLITFTRGMTATVNTAAGTNVVVDATSGSDNFDPLTSNLGASLAYLGNVSYQPIGTSANLLGDSANIAGGSVVSTAFVTITGPSIAAALAANGNSGVFLDANSTSCTVRSRTVSASATNSVTFNGVSVANLLAGVNVCLNVSGGTTVIGTGQHTATLAVNPATSVTADVTLSGQNVLDTVISNGTVSNAYMVNASTSTAKTSVIRLINTGSAAAAFTATAYAVDTGLGDGNPVALTPLGTANSVLGTIAVGGALNLTSAQLESKLGFTPSGGTTKYRVVISAGTNAQQILNYTKDIASGAIVLSQ
jgi:hypothetical protein